MKKSIPSGKSVQELSSLIASIALMIAIALQFYKVESTKKSLIDNHQIKSINDSLVSLIKVQTQNINQFKLLMTDTAKSDLQYRNQIHDISIRLARLEEQTKGLREAINPIDPEEVLTIARLNDGLKNLTITQNSISKDFDDKLELFKVSVIRELETSSRSINWLFLVLIPIVVNLLYTIWRDRKENKT
jgi:hypothetical protein